MYVLTTSGNSWNELKYNLILGAVGALVKEAEHAESKADFIHKMAIAQKEANETEYWIELLHQSEYLNASQYNSIITDIQKLNKILASIIITSKDNNYGKR